MQTVFVCTSTLFSSTDSWCQLWLAWKGLVRSTYFLELKIVQTLFTKRMAFNKPNCKQNDIYLSWKTNEFQSLILTPAWQNIGEWTVWIFVERSLMPRLFGSHNTKQGHSKGHYSVDENQKLRIFELSYLTGRVHVLACHNFLLENTWNGKINILEKLKI